MRAPKSNKVVALLSITALLLTGCAASSDTGQSASPAVAEHPAADPSERDRAVYAELAGVEVVVTNPVSISEFRDHLRWYPRGGVESGSPASVCVEYLAAATGFPLELPDGYAFPANPTDWFTAGLSEYDCEAEATGYIEQGSGLFAAIDFWRYATTTAAVGAHNRGKADVASSYLDALENGVNENLHEIYVRPDPPATPEPYQPVVDARNGDWDALRADVALFLTSPIHTQIAEEAGDTL